MFTAGLFDGDGIEVVGVPGDFIEGTVGLGCPVEFGVFAAVFRHATGVRPFAAASRVVVGQRLGDRRRAGGFGPEHHHAGCQPGPSGGCQILPAPGEVAPNRGGAEGSSLDRHRHRSEPPREFGAVGVTAVDGVDRLRCARCPQPRAHGSDLRGPHLVVGDVQRCVAGNSGDAHVGMFRAQPCHTVGQWDGLGGGLHRKHRDLVALPRYLPDQVVMTLVWRVELPDQQPVPVVGHAAESSASSGVSAGPSASACRHDRRPARHIPRNSTYTSAVRLRCLTAYSGT